jgi:hypothetical protein
MRRRERGESESEREMQKFNAALLGTLLSKSVTLFLTPSPLSDPRLASPTYLPAPCSRVLSL